MSASTASRTLLRSALVASTTGAPPVGGTKSAPNRRLKTFRGLYSGGLKLSGPLWERYLSVVPSPPTTFFDTPTSSDLNLVVVPMTAAATWSMLGCAEGRNVVRVGVRLGDHRAPDMIPVDPGVMAALVARLDVHPGDDVDVVLHPGRSERLQGRAGRPSPPRWCRAPSDRCLTPLPQKKIPSRFGMRAGLGVGGAVGVEHRFERRQSDGDADAADRAAEDRPPIQDELAHDVGPP